MSYETLLKKVSQKEMELDQLLRINKKLETDLKNQKGAMEGILNLKIDDEVSKARNEINKIINEAKAIVEASQRNEINKTKKIEEKAHHLSYPNIKNWVGLRKNLPFSYTEHGDLNIKMIQIEMSFSLISLKKILLSRELIKEKMK